MRNHHSHNLQSKLIDNKLVKLYYAITSSYYACNKKSFTELNIKGNYNHHAIQLVVFDFINSTAEEEINFMHYPC